jgi:cob(I)alamin adenosyltransferase
MTQLTDEHFELHTKNKAEQFERQKIKFLEDRIKTLEKTLESHSQILARFQMTEANEADFQRHEKIWGDR